MGPKEAYVKLGVAGVAAAAAERLSVTEVLDAPKATLTTEGGRVVVRRKGSPVTLVDRVLNPQLAVPCSVQELPDANCVYEVAYFNSPSPVLAEYGGVPKGGMVLLSVRRGQEYEGAAVLQGTADAMGIAPPPVLFDGALPDTSRLTEVFKRSLREEPSAKDLLEALGLEPKFGVSGAAFGGVVVRLGSLGSTVVRFGDHLLEEARSAEMGARAPLDMYGIVLCDFVTYCEAEVDLDECVHSEGALDERLLKTVSSIYLRYVGSRKGVFDECTLADVDLPMDESLLGEDVRKSFDEQPNNRKIFQMVLQAMHVPKKKPTGTLTESILSAIGRLRSRINGKISTGYSADWPTFEEYLMMKK